MNSNKILPFIAAAVAIVIGLIVIVQVISGDGNAISGLAGYLVIGCVIIALLKPASGIFLLLVQGFYLDTLKRLLVVEGKFGFNDVIQILAMAPATLAAVCIGLLFKSFIFGKGLSRAQGISLGVGIVLSGLMFVSAVVSSGGLFSGISLAANSATYVAMLFVAFMMYRNTESQLKFWNTAVILFVPVTIYAWVQLTFGYSDLERLYALSGLTQTTYILEPGNDRYYRIMSTMSSGAAYGLCSIILGMFAFWRSWQASGAKRVGYLVFSAIVFGSMIPGAGRTGFAVIVIVLFAMFCFSRKNTTLAFYSAAIVGVVAVIASGAEIIYWGLDIADNFSANTDWQRKMLNVNTYSTRVMSFQSWLEDRSLFSWFGLSAEKVNNSGAHDLIGQVYVRYGLAGVLASLIAGIYVIVTIHSRIFASPKGSLERRMAIFYISVLVSFVVAAVLSGSLFGVFPANLFFWGMLGFVFSLQVEKEVPVIRAKGRETIPQHARFGAPVR